MENSAVQTTNKANNILIESEAQIAIQELAAAKASKGDREALAQLCEHIAKGVLFRMSRMLRNRVDAEDAAQEALIRVCKSIGQLKNPKTFRKWLGTIIVNEARRKGMQNARISDNVIHLTDLTEAAVDDDENFLPEQFAMNAESRRTVIEAIDRLPQRQKEAVLLHYYDRLNVTETAEVMGISQPAASIHLKEACSRIKRDLESSADKLMKAMQGFVAIPLSDMLFRALYTESASFVPASQTWMADTIAKCSDLAIVGAVAAGGVAGAGLYSSASAGGTAATSTSAVVTAAKTLLTVVAATTATLGITIGAIVLHSSQQDDRPSTNATGSVIFTGDYEQSYINPTEASASSDSEQGKLKVHNWEIQTIDRTTILYAGESDTVTENVFATMREDGNLGNFKLVFILEDANGVKYELAHNFYLFNEETELDEEDIYNEIEPDQEEILSTQMEDVDYE